MNATLESIGAWIDETAPEALKRSHSWIARPTGTVAVPLWWTRFRQVATSTEVHQHAMLRLLRDRGGIDLSGSPFTHDGGGPAGEALRAFLLAERIERERTVLREAAAEATEPGQAADAAMAASRTAQATTRRRL